MFLTIFFNKITKKKNSAVKVNNILFGLNEIASNDYSGDDSGDEDTIISDDNDEDEEQESDHENQILGQNTFSKNGEEIWSTFLYLLSIL